MRTRILILATLVLAACGDDGDEKPVNPDGGAPLDGAVTMDAAQTSADAAVDSTVVQPPSDCFLNPKTYVEIINACTDSDKVTKNPVLPLLGADGKLPPLP